ncbi:MAG: hypothetical protein ACP5FK_00740 [bacterium]
MILNKLSLIIRTEINERVGEYLSELMQSELTNFLERDRYKYVEGETNYRNGS